jgi:hypothetical protein
MLTICFETETGTNKAITFLCRHIGGFVGIAFVANNCFGSFARWVTSPVRFGTSFKKT